jgi:hypothetical protein
VENKEQAIGVDGKWIEVGMRKMIYKHVVPRV